jgi:hypothetical protein
VLFTFNGGARGKKAMIAQSLTARKTIEMSIMRVLLFMSIFSLWAGEAAFDPGQQPASPFENEDVALLRRRSLETVIDTRKPGTQDTGYNIGKSGSYFKKCYASKGKGKGSSVSKGSKASKCDGRITQLKLKWNGAGPVTIRPRTIGALTPIEVIKNGDVITIEWASRYSKYKNDQYIDIYEGERKIGQSVFHISWYVRESLAYNHVDVHVYSHPLWCQLRRWHGYG